MMAKRARGFKPVARSAFYDNARFQDYGYVNPGSGRGVVLHGDDIGTLPT